MENRSAHPGGSSFGAGLPIDTKNGLLPKRNLLGFLATPPDEAKRCFAPVFTLACPPKVSTLFPCKPVQCGIVRRSGAGYCHVQVKQIGSGVPQRVSREQLPEAARRREMDAVLVWRPDRWGRSVTDLLATLQELQPLGMFHILSKRLDV